MVLTCIENTAGQADVKYHNRGSLSGLILRSQYMAVSVLIRFLIFAIIKLQFYLFASSL